jgi:parallel beta-helix repeat protein
LDNRTISGIVAILLIATVLVTSFGTNPVKAVSSTITVPDDYSTIQEAINHASDGDTVFVRAGTYNESVVINRTVSLIGENRETTIIQAAAPTMYGVLVTSDNVTFIGFTVCKSLWWGIQVQSSGCHISDSNFSEEEYNGEGIFLDGRNAQVNDNVVANNTVLNNGDAGIHVWTSNGNHIESNIIGNSCFGIYIEWSSSRNMIERNEIFNNSIVGIPLTTGAFGNTITCNNISDCGWSSNWGEGTGAITFGSESVGNRIVANLICNSRRGVDLRDFSNNNVFYHNSFIDNSVQVTNDIGLPSLCIWDGGYSQGGNYWSDYNGIDVKKGLYQNETGSDGVADSPYTIDVYNQDRYPLMKPYVPMFGDCNGDGVINLQDSMIVALAFGTYPDSARWNPLADINKDGTVNLKDLLAVYIRFGKTYIPQ